MRRAWVQVPSGTMSSSGSPERPSPSCNGRAPGAGKPGRAADDNPLGNRHRAAQIPVSMPCVGFRESQGLSERVIYRELFPSGLTQLDKGQLGELGTSHTYVWGGEEPRKIKPVKVGLLGADIAFDGQGYVFITVGDRQAPSTGDLEAHPAQDLSNHHGTIIRLHDDGRVPDDNPFVGRAGALPEIWSYGHRNPQGLDTDPATGALWDVEHGPRGGDELNLVEKGRNYGWPIVAYGEEYSGRAIQGAETHRPGYEQPVYYWDPVIAPSGAQWYDGDAFPAWRGSLFVGSMVQRRLVRLVIEDGRVAGEEHLLAHRGRRIRDVRQGPDGYIYLAIEDEDRKPTSILRMEPVARGSN